MWMRFEATARRPASSSILVTAPVRLRRVASGLMIEKVRVTAMGKLLLCIGSGCARLSPRFCCTARTKGEGAHARRSAAHAVGDAASPLAAFLQGGDLAPRLVLASSDSHRLGQEG